MCAKKTHKSGAGWILRKRRSTLSKQSHGLQYGFSYLPLQLTIQTNSLERHLNVSFQFITIKVEVSTHENDASEETV